jgi:hypothetical protein
LLGEHVIARPRVHSDVRSEEEKGEVVQKRLARFRKPKEEAKAIPRSRKSKATTSVVEEAKSDLERTFV